MRRHLLSSLLTCRIASSAAAFLVLGQTLFLNRYITNSPSNRRAGDFSACRQHGSIFAGVVRRNVALCEQQQQQKDGFTTERTETNQQPRNGMEKGNEVQDDENIRLRLTPLDFYFQKYGWLPLPKTTHKVLKDSDDQINSPDRKGILVIGDVHGCFEELQLLHKEAVEENDGMDFRFVILVGDLCNKGPFPARVIRFVRQEPNWLAVRGNHDNAALGAALGNEYRRKHPKYDWVQEGENRNATETSDKIVLSDKDVMWMSDLPYTITIPASMFGDEETVDTVVVHAGFIPGVPVEDQDVPNMIHLREVVEVYSTQGGGDTDGKQLKVTRTYAPYRASKRERNTEGDPHPLPWAPTWKGPQRVIFGHDAKRGFQRYAGDWAIGLDTGAVYGNQLTGIILPQKKIVSVDAVAEHVPVKEAQDTKT